MPTILCSYIYSGHFFQGYVSTHKDLARQKSKHTVPGSPATPVRLTALHPYRGSAQSSLTHRCAPLRLQALSAVLEHRASVTGFLNYLAPPPRLESHPLQILPPTHPTPPSLANPNPSPAPAVTRHSGLGYRGPGDKGWIAPEELVRPSQEKPVEEGFKNPGFR